MFNLHLLQPLLCRITKIQLFAVDNVELTLNFKHLYICYFCYLYKIVLLKAISIIATGSHPMWEIAKVFFVNITT